MCRYKATVHSLGRGVCCKLLRVSLVGNYNYLVKRILLFIYFLSVIATGYAELNDSVPVSVSVLDELEVTSIKQSSGYKDEALSSTILTRATLEEAGAVSIKGISDMVPNFYIPDYGSRITSSIYVRGIGARMDQPAVGLIVDNVPIMNKDAYDFDLDDIREVAMLRGPQSTLYGRNTMGGLINITTLSPMRFQGVRAMAEVGNGESVRVGAGYYGKLKEDMAASVTASFSHSAGFFKNEYNGKKIDKDLSASLRFKYQWHISGEWDINNVLASNILRQGGYPYEYINTGKIAYNDTCFYHRFTINDGLTAAWRGDSFTVSSITSVQHIDDNMTLDQDFLPESYFTLTQKKKESGLTEDIIMKKKDTQSPYVWTNGVFGFYKHLSMQAPVTFKDMGISSLIEKHRNEANPNYPISWDERVFPLNSDFKVPAWGMAIYHESTFTTGRWKFTAGLRFDFEHTRLNYHSFCSTGYTVNHIVDGVSELYRHVPVVIDERGVLNKNFFNWLPTVSALYDFSNSDIIGNAYINISKGSKAGGFNTQMFSDVLQQKLMNVMGIGSSYDTEKILGYKPEYSWNYEIGAHINSPERRIDADLTVFYIDCRDQQMTMFPDGTTTGRIMTNAGHTRSYGLEASLNLNPVKWLYLTGAYGFTNARFVDFYDGKANYKGKRLPYAPSNTLFLQSIFDLPVNDKVVKNVTLDVNMRGTGDIYWNESNSLSQKFYALLGASATLNTSKWSLQLWASNLTSTKYYTFYFMSMGNEFVQRGKPLQFGVTFRLTI